MRVQPDGFNFLVGVVLFCLLSSSQSGKAVQPPAEKQIDTIFSGITSAQEPGLAVVVRQNGRTVFLRGYGLRDLRSNL
ncbi:MAG TPA: hypothetical protein VGR72_03170, partial [Candidatus Acidoferrales bacterium]|nr:hypothetical protein [Candidatus Acidoferrales bacterium]